MQEVRVQNHESRYDERNAHVSSSERYRGTGVIENQESKLCLYVYIHVGHTVYNL